MRTLSCLSLASIAAHCVELKKIHWTPSIIHWMETT